MTEAELRRRYGNAAIEALRRQLDAGASPEIDVEQLNANLASTRPPIDVLGLLRDAEAVGWLKRTDYFICPIDGCAQVLDPEMVEARQCPYCGTDFRESGDVPQRRSAYQSLGPLSRSTAWLIAIHGFNTAGTWQELFSWLVASLYRYRAPVLIYKYGLVRVGVLFRWRHRMLARQLGRKIQRAARQAADNQIHDPPDVIIHSFGSQLFRLVLEMEEFKQLKFGRVIAVGSIIRPDFDWDAHIRGGRLEAIMNQCGGRDWAVPWAQFTIPGSGPGGRHGFTDPVVTNLMAPDYAHSGAFKEDQLLTNLSSEGRWERFLRVPLAGFADPSRFVPEAWRPWPWIMRWLSRAAVIALLLLVTLIVIYVAALGVSDAMRDLGQSS